MLVFTIENMTCGHCTRAIHQAITEADSQAKIVTDLEHKTLQVESDLSAEKLILILDEEGYTAKLKV